MEFEKFKKVFDESFGKVTPADFIRKMEALGYIFKPYSDRKPPSRCCGRCDGHNDICVSDQVCDSHDKEGCTVCWPHPFDEFKGCIDPLVSVLGCSKPKGSCSNCK